MKIIKKAKERTAEDNRQLRQTVSDIIDDVCARGDDALRDYSRNFDGFVREGFRITRDEIDAAYAKMDPADIEDLQAARANIEAFAKAQLASMSEVTDFSPQPGIYLGHKIIPVSSCCCYVPGGRYPLFSTALMLITPAKVAGVKRVVATAPVVHGTGDINYKTLVAMDLAGADEIYAVGGAQAIAAFSYGTDQIQPVDVIVGPGNQYVAEAKRQCYGQVGIDFVAGPSEVLAIADSAAEPDVLAADLLAQCEHDPNAKAFLLTTDETLAKAVIAAVEKELETLETADVARSSWEDYGEVVLLDDLDEAVRVCNEYAPEHLEVNIQNPDEILDQLTNYGSLFIGGNTAEAFGDYASGTNHTLPTVRAARYTGGVWVGTFLKVCTNQRMTAEASSAIAPLVDRMARGEGLIAHAIAAQKRF
ncbi:MAG: histidinol dehydrogenase [Bacillota bacterium]|nr:histidinol dehydrogenase [Bacillota bacterium]